MPRDVILDTQGRAVEDSLKQQGYSVESCRIGKYIELNIVSENSKEALTKAESLVKEAGLYNPLIEKYDLVNL